MKKNFLDYKKTISLLLGFLAVSSLPPYYFFPSLFISFSGLLLLIDNQQKPMKSFWYGYLFGFGFFSLGFSWVGNALLIDANTFGWLYPICLIGSGLFFGFFIAIPTWLTNKIFKGSYQRMFALAIFWTLSEWIRSFILTGFPWNLLGSVLAFNLNLIQFADLFGTYGLSLLLIIFCSSPAVFIRKRNKQSLIFMLSILISLPIIICGYGMIKLSKNKTSENSDIIIRMVQPSIPQTMKWNEQSLIDNFNEYVNLSKSKDLKNIDFTIWGETASPFPLDLYPDYRLKATDSISEKGYLIAGSVRYAVNMEEKKYQPANSLFIINKKGEIVKTYDKAHLVPFGEYIPLKKYLPSWIRPVTNAIADMKQGDGNETIKIENYPSFGGLICYEIIFPSQIIDKSNRPQWIINITNDGWYGKSSGPYQHLVTTQLRAIEEGLTIVRVANSGISALISSNGEILGQIPLGEKDFLDMALPKNLYIETLYSKFGNYLIVIFCLISLFLMELWNQKNKQNI